MTPADSSDAPGPERQADLDRYLKERLGDQVVRSPEERELIEFVEQFVDASGSAFPRPRGHVVSKQGNGWNVTLLDLEALRRGERPKELTYHVTRKGSHLSIAHGVVP